ncbi:hydroxyisourate hydrolase [Stappia sp. GBMRC 2046]|uniref:5-hydroxyisourate hydrolase n=1 Tax=Stappia sediminis TaxID=2692190 RepID=A0A7X3LYD8_9HYPH|nr:hydroxyisourate hydrolase [Stappia sediminis]MXN67459.1 hydroxyisourate hydrolase [Stappia sediminis]
MSDSAGYVTTHILDTANGCPAANVRIVAYRIEGDRREELVDISTNHDGRTDQPVIGKGSLRAGVYEIDFHIGDYFKARGLESATPFLDVVPVRFGIDDAGEHYHVPLLASPFGYSTYRGS